MKSINLYIETSSTAFQKKETLRLCTGIHKKEHPNNKRRLPNRKRHIQSRNFKNFNRSSKESERAVQNLYLFQKSICTLRNQGQDGDMGKGRF